LADPQVKHHTNDSGGIVGSIQKAMVEGLDKAINANIGRVQIDMQVAIEVSALFGPSRDFMMGSSILSMRLRWQGRLL
jgi:hypothetical protein